MSESPNDISDFKSEWTDNAEDNLSESPNNVSDFKSEWTDTVEYNLPESPNNVSDFVHGESLHTMEFHKVDPSAAEMAASIFHSFKAGIADAIFSFKCRKPFIFMKNRHLQC